MSLPSEKNQFRRLVGDFPAGTIIDADIESYLDDATAELTADFVDVTGASLPVTDFDALKKQYHPEIILWAAINWWWNKAGQLADRHSQAVGQASEQMSEKWDRAMAMIKELEARYAIVQQLGTDITVGDFSRFSKRTLSRLGGQSEEAALKEIDG